MLVTHLRYNTEERFSMLQLVDEGSTIYRYCLHPLSAGKSSVSESFLSNDFIIRMFDGSRLSNDTKDAWKSNQVCDIIRHGICAYINVQPSCLFKSMAAYDDEEGIYNRMLFSFGERKMYDPSQSDTAAEDKDLSFMKGMFEGATTEDLHFEQDRPLTYQVFTIIRYN